MTIGRTLEFYSVNFPSDIRGRKRNKIVIGIIILSVIIRTTKRKFIWLFPILYLIHKK